jgi:homoaconitase/3-isopropylmalate dehydratase large subunit
MMMKNCMHLRAGMVAPDEITFNYLKGRRVLMNPRNIDLDKTHQNTWVHQWFIIITPLYRDYTPLLRWPFGGV